MRKYIYKLSGILSASLLCFNINAAESWDGYFIGISAGSNDTLSSQPYSQTIGSSACHSNNYGSMGLGASCGGSENYQKKYSNSQNLNSASFRIGRYWQNSYLTLGILGEYSKTSHYNKNNSEVITSAFGDTLSVSAKKDDSISILGLAGEQDIKYTPPYNLPRSFEKSERVWGFSAGAGLKWKFQNNFILSGEYLYTDYGNTKVSANSYLPPGGGGIKYPSTSLDTEFIVKTFNIGLEYKF
ncbi:MAG: outer membrane beta-barrel protein [Candidatus Methylopumilus sp.]|nr:outer membrane beta-barrel protein [Candidatus Methylopumilus sp.]